MQLATMSTFTFTPTCEVVAAAAAAAAAQNAQPSEHHAHSSPIPTPKTPSNNANSSIEAAVEAICASTNSGTSSPSFTSKHRHSSSASTRSSGSNSSSLDEGLGGTGSGHHQQAEPNELLIDHNQSAIAIEVPSSTLKIDLGPFRPPADLSAEPGDIVEFDRILSSHWAIYVGEGEVVHVSGCPPGGGGQGEVPDDEFATVQRAPLAVVAGDSFCRVNNKLLRAKERGMLPFHNEIVVRKALSKVGVVTFCFLNIFVAIFCYFFIFKIVCHLQ